MAQNFQHIHITGASGSGVSTLGSRLASELSHQFIDTDDVYWLPTNPPYLNKRPPEKRVQLLNEQMIQAPAVIAGSMDGWGDLLIPHFAKVIFIYTPLEIRLTRLRQREEKKFAERLLPSGDMHQQHQDFLKWAAAYESGTMEGRSLPRHHAWLKQLLCPVLELDGSLPLAALTEQALAFIKQ